MQSSRQIHITSRIPSRMIALLTFALVFTPWVHAHAQSAASCKIRVVTHDEASKPIPDVLVEVTTADASVVSAKSNQKGETDFVLAPGTYDVTVKKSGFEPMSQKAISVAAGLPIEIVFVLVPTVVLKQSVDVNANSETTIEKSSSTPTQLERVTVKYTTDKPATVTDTLPLVPGVVRTPEGQIKISGSAEHRSALIVNSADVTDPATGQFGVTIPVDSVETINVFKTPYIAQYGRFTAGVVSVETRRGSDKWVFEFNDPLPVYRVRSGHIRGVKEYSPRLILNGPLVPGKLFISQGAEYEMKKQPDKTLPFPHNETKKEAVNSFSQFDYILSPLHTLTATIHLAPGHTSFANLNFFNQQPVAPNFSAHDYTGTLIDRLTIGKNLLESTLAIKRFDVSVWGQGQEDMILKPTGNFGNYYSEQDRDAARIEWIEIFSLAPLRKNGNHNFKFGTSVGRTTNQGRFVARTTQIQDNDARLLTKIEFAPGEPFDLTDIETNFFGQDHWVITPKLAMDLGLRFERQGITEMLRFAPRAGVAWTPLKNQQTTVRGGFGLFYDRVPLSVYAFDHYPNMVVTTFGSNFEIIEGPHRFRNVIGRGDTSGFAFVFGKDRAGNFAPYSATWNIEVEHPITSQLRVRASWLQNRSRGVMIIQPKPLEDQGVLELSGEGRSRYQQLEVTSRLGLKTGQLFFSYVHSRARGDVNEFNTYLGNFPFPVVRQNEYSVLPADLPNRFLAWGLVKFPWSTRLAPILEWRNGFPYSVVDARQRYVGLPNTTRFPNFFSFDARASKDVKLNDKYTLRFSVSGYNITSHFNPRQVHMNVDDPEFGIHFYPYRRRFRFDFDVIF
jgi:Carboxypeptidase regulatory-like domain/TonB dependent receptor-like, beta-barrel